MVESIVSGLRQLSLNIIYLFIYLPAPDLSCGMWYLVPRPGIQPRSSALGAALTVEFISGFPGGSDDKESAYYAEDPGSIPGLGRSPEENGSPLRYSCLKNPMDREAWRATVHGSQRVRHDGDATNTFTRLPSPSSVTLDKLLDLSEPQLGLLWIKPCQTLSTDTLALSST